MGKKYLIDTCAVIKYLAEIFPNKALLFMDAIVDEDCIVSFITKIELLSWNPPEPEALSIRKEFLAGSYIHFVDDRVIEKAIQLRKDKKLKLPDAIIAATAISNDLVLLSDNDTDFGRCDGLKYLNPKHMK